MVWYAHLFQNFPQFLVIHTVKGFGIVNKAEIDVFLELSCFFDDPGDVDNLICSAKIYIHSITIATNNFIFNVDCLIEFITAFTMMSDVSAL